MFDESPVSDSLVAAFMVHDDHYFLEECLKRLDVSEKVVFIGRTPWNGEPGDWEKSVSIAEKLGAEVVLGDWESETAQRTAVLGEMKKRGVVALLILDTDEILEVSLLNQIKLVAKCSLADRISVDMITYWKDIEHVIHPPEKLTPYVFVNPQICTTSGFRHYDGGRQLHLGSDYGLMHHLSYVGPDERIRRKVTTWGHASEVKEEWWKEKWLGWDNDRITLNLHPTHPEAYRQALRLETPLILRGIDSQREELQSSEDCLTSTVSIIIPLYGGESDIRDCLSRISDFRTSVHEVIVVDDCSPDGALSVASEFSFVTVKRNDRNMGFAATCNIGVEEATGEIIVLLNSDAVLCKRAFEILVRTLEADEMIGAVGPMSDNVSYFQSIGIERPSISQLDLFVEDFALRSLPDEKVSMLVGFCLAIRRSDFLKVDGFNTEYGQGLFEDNEISLKLQELGKSLVISHRAFVSHKGSQSLNRLGIDVSRLLVENQEKFHAKYSKLVQSGYISHLPGEQREPIRFDYSKSPAVLKARLKELCVAADISLCMIVKDEQRVLKECLRSVQGVFTQVIVVDTGSNDRTVEIAREFTSDIFQIEWPNSFAAARNESLKHATGKWIMWMDADDTLPEWCAERILNSVISAPPQVVGFIVPVQFVENGAPAGTRVDHVKIFRNLPGLEFEGRIHEQILASLRRIGGDILRIDAFVLHSGYDTSEQGQKKKRRRDSTLLQLDLQDRPGHPFVLFNLGMTAYFNGEDESALDWLQQCLSVSQVHESHVRKAFSMMGCALIRTGRFIEAIELFKEALRKVNGDPEIRFHLARAYGTLGRVHEARLEYEAVRQEPIGEFSSFDTGILGGKLDFNHAMICKMMGDNAAAKRSFTAALDSSEVSVNAAQELYALALESEDFRQARIALDYLLNSEDVESWSDMFVKLCQAKGDDPLQEFVKLLGHHPENSFLRLALGRHLLQVGDHEGGQTILEPLAERGMGRASYYLGISFLTRGFYAQALKFIQKTLELDPHHQPSLVALKSIQAQMTS